jgi:hypothetical protein
MNSITLHVPDSTKLCLDMNYFSGHREGHCDLCRKKAVTIQKIVFWHYRPKLRHKRVDDADIYLFSTELCETCTERNTLVKEVWARDDWDVMDAFNKDLNRTQGIELLRYFDSKDNFCDLCRQEAYTKQKVVLWHCNIDIELPSNLFALSFELCRNCTKRNEKINHVWASDQADALDNLLN